MLFGIRQSYKKTQRSCRGYGYKIKTLTTILIVIDFTLLYLEKINVKVIIDYDSSLFNIDIAGPPPRVGAVLVSEPFLHDEYFRHSVISLVEYAPDGTSMGIVLNHPTDFFLQELVPAVRVGRPIEVRCGGPLSDDRLYYIHTLAGVIPGSRAITPGMFIGGDFDAVVDYINAGYPIDGSILFFLGYSGWSPGQLDEEVANRVWAVAPATDPTELMHTPSASMWHSQVRHLGSKYRGWLYHPRIPLSN